MIRLYGSAYLNLQHQDSYIDILCDCIRQYGVSNPVSRLSEFTNSECYEAVENELAKTFGTQCACLLPNGYLSGIAIKNALLIIAGRHNLKLIYDANGHPCYQAKRHLVYESVLSLSGGFIVIINSINSFYGCIDETFFLSKLGGVNILAIDVSHTAHISDHSGLLKNLNKNIEVVFFGSLNKAAAFSAGFVAGNKTIIDLIRSQPEYSASTPPSIASVHTYMLSKTLRDSSKNHLIELIGLFQSEFEHVERNTNEYFPVFKIDDNSDMAYNKLLSIGYETSYMSYPYQRSMKQLRLILNAGLSKCQVANLACTLKELNINPQSYDYNQQIDVVVETPSNETLHRTAIPLRSIAAGEL